MADKKISALTGAATPLAGTEVLPIVQSGATVKVAVSDLTAGRAVAVSSLTSQGTVQTTTAGTGLIGNGISRTGGTTADWFNYIPSGVSDLRWFKGDIGGDIVSLSGTNGNVSVVLGNIVIGTAGKGIVDSTSAVALNFSSTAATLNSPLAQTGTINTLTNDFSARAASMALNDTLTISNLTTGVIEISEMAFFSNIAVIAVSGAATAIVYRSDLATTITAGNPGTLNVYRSGANVIIENKNAATLQVRTNIRKLG